MPSEFYPKRDAIALTPAPKAIAMPKKLLLPKTIAPPYLQKVIALCVPIPSNGNFKV
ncbi:MAG: hypothetical protein GPJ21_17095 [Microcystis aeruginosa W13-11]|nr:hypothetical protein [Microcystis aeruginosa W13-11]